MDVSDKSKFLRNQMIAIFIFIASSAISLAFLECIIRVIFPAFDPSGQVQLVVGTHGLTLGPANQKVRLTRTAGDYDVAVRFNARGFRDAKDVATVRSGDIVIVGDFFAFGWGVEESERFSDVLQPLLHRRVFNIGIPGGDFDDYDKLLKYAKSFGGQIDDVVISVCMENDLRSYSAPGQSALNTDENVAIAHPLDLEVTKAWLADNSATYRMVTAVVHQNPWLRRVAISSNLLTPTLAGIVANIDSQLSIESSADRLAEIASRYKHTVILIIPSRGLWVGGNRRAEDRIHREFISALATRHLDLIDMRSTLESGGNPLFYHFRNDGHWNSRGHQLAAAALVGAFTH